MVNINQNIFKKFFIVSFIFITSFYVGPSTCKASGDSDTPLHIAVRENKIGSIEELIKQGADKEAKDKHGWTPLHWAAYFNRAQAAEKLIELGADKKVKSNHEKSPLHLAAEFCNIEVLTRLVELGVDKESTMDSGFTSLHWAAYLNKVISIEKLVELGADIQAQDDDERTPLHVAAINNKVEALEILVKLGADKEAKDDFGKAPLHEAVEKNKIEAIEKLIELGANKESRYGSLTPLHWAAYLNKVEALETLVALEADIEAQDKDGLTPLHWAVEKSSVESMEKLIELGAKKNAQDKGGWTLLHRAAAGDNVEVITKLVELGMNLQKKDNHGQTPLRLAQKKKSVEAIALLESLARVDKSLKTKTGFSLAELVRSLNNYKVKYSADGDKILIYPDGTNADVIVLGSLGIGCLILALSFFCIEETDNGPAEALSVLGALFLGYAIIKPSIVNLQPTVVLDKDKIFYQDRGFLWDSEPKKLSWSDVKNIETRVRSWMSTTYHSAPTFNSDWSVGTTMIPQDRVVSERDIVVKTKPHWNSIFIPESKMPISFESFYDLVVPHFWSAE